MALSLLLRGILFVTLLGAGFFYIYVYSVTNWSFCHPQPAAASVGTRDRTTSQRRPANILILAQPRTGSSFLGQIFNQHPDVFFLYEPLHPFTMFEKLNHFNKTKYNVLVASFLRNAYNCSFNGFQDYLNFMSHPGLTSPHLRLSSKALSSPPLCKSVVQTFSNHSDFLINCPLLNAKSVSRVCSSKKLVVTKVLVHRLPSEDLWELPARVVHLARDPRAIVWSMLKMELLSRDIDKLSVEKRSAGPASTKESMYNSPFNQQVKAVCDKMAIDLNIFRHLSKHLTQLYKIVRYEELANNTVQTVQSIFEFAGLDLAPEVTEWVRKNALSNESDVYSIQDSYTTTNRNAALISKSWRRSLTFDETRVIDKLCSTFMKKFGYHSIGSEESLWNTNVSLLI